MNEVMKWVTDSVVVQNTTGNLPYGRLSVVSCVGTCIVEADEVEHEALFPWLLGVTNRSQS
jgi:hypothetical protein